MKNVMMCFHMNTIFRSIFPKFLTVGHSFQTCWLLQFLLKTLGHLYFCHVESEILNVKQPIDPQEAGGERKPENGIAEDKATESQREDEAPKESQHESDGIKENDTEPQHENDVAEADVKEPVEAVDESVAVNQKAESDKHSETEEENGSDDDSESDSDEYTTAESGSSESRSDGSESEGEVSESHLRICHGNLAQKHLQPTTLVKNLGTLT